MGSAIMKPSQLLFIVILMLAITPSQAEIYKWVDDAGGTHYSERMPDVELPVEEIHPTGVKTPGRQETWRERNEAFAERKTDEEEQAKKDSEDAAYNEKVRQNCEQAKTWAASLEPPRINKIDEDGTPAHACRKNGDNRS